MAEFEHGNSFSWGDALFLYLERPGQPLSIGSVSIFEGAIPLKTCRDFVESKLPLIPRYRQHVVFPPLNLGLPSWQFDPNFDIRNHVRQITLKQGTENDLKKIASEILSTSLDRQRPLWDITLVRGLEGGRTGLVARIHHCLADGIAGVELMTVLMNPSREMPVIPKHKPVFQAPAHRDAGAELIDGLVKSYFSAVKGALTLQSEALQIAQEAIANPTGPLSDLLNIMPELATPSDRLPFNIVCQGPQKFAWTEIPMAEIQAVRHSCGATVNDVILTVVTAAIRRYSELRGVRVKERSARIMIPVNIRANGDAKQLGNRILFIPISIPLDVRDPQKLLAFVRERTEYLKRARAAEFVGFAGGMVSTIPTAILAAIAPLASQLPLSLCNTICTNVPGPPIPVYLLGRKMLSWYPYVPIGGEMGFNCAILSYNGTAYFGFTCDANAVPDPEHLEKFVDKSFAELRSSSRAAKPVVDEKPAAPRRKRPNATISVAAKPLEKVRKPRTKAKAKPPEPAVDRVKKPSKRAAPEASPATLGPVPETEPATARKTIAEVAPSIAAPIAPASERQEPAVVLQAAGD
jgi:diacylglycerol O-acyltransferase / wax synthase